MKEFTENNFEKNAHILCPDDAAEALAIVSAVLEVIERNARSGEHSFLTSPSNILTLCLAQVALKEGMGRKESANFVKSVSTLLLGNIEANRMANEQRIKGNG